MFNGQKDMNVNRLALELNRVKEQHRDLEEEIEEREQQWAGINDELGNVKRQMALVADQV